MNNRELPTNTILIVDDESDTINVLLDALAQAHFTTYVALDGESALQQLAETALAPDLILLDVMMPGIDGFETCRRLKANAATRDIPVLFMTALTDMVNKINGFAVGGVDYITKPFQIEEVLARVQAHLTIRRQQREIEAQREQLRELNAHKDKFFSILAHDLKNPVMGFLSMEHILENFDDLAPEQRVAVTTQFRDSARNLFALIENLMTWSQMQQDMLVCYPQEVPFMAFVDRNFKLLTPTAAQKQLQLQHRIQDDLLVIGDVMMIDTVVRNLLTNAIKFTRPGGVITMSASCDARLATVAVTDTGIGIPAEKLPDLFRIDVKYQRDGTADEKGTGLGLILCKEFVERNGGKIWVESEVGRGTTFYFTLPARLAAEQAHA
ncbi:response regulator receiver sensor signal transduction histidine kinase [Candidatus Vecturithrix granuli]|uniref:histidine kinase n=1 Tax=Vecturithrix granuli TaxID=1499967 RepID=A0A0S6WBM2_VECG1|nr:response regulator receiver sensor signal transduction histidine kinase [Candidatus Vecturithrix granuli]